jgi:basic membrane lipoprotein Med (substrate-binding protein (PBP1-ABC) superfamily)
VKVQMIENINYADMEQALTNLASKNQLVIGVGGQTQAAVLKIAKRFPRPSSPSSAATRPRRCPTWPATT